LQAVDYGERENTRGHTTETEAATVAARAQKPKSFVSVWKHRAQPFKAIRLRLVVTRRLAASSGVSSLLSDFGGLWYLQITDAIGYAEFYSRSHDAVIRVYDESGNVIETHEHAGDFREW
jgi:hypothetical protein